MRALPLIVASLRLRSRAKILRSCHTLRSITIGPLNITNTILLAPYQNYRYNIPQNPILTTLNPILSIKAPALPEIMGAVHVEPGRGPLAECS